MNNNSKKIVGLIYATNLSGAIGKITTEFPGGTLPWTKQRGDLKHFLLTTKGSIVIMGKNTWESIKRPLVGRVNIVVSSTIDPNLGHFADPQYNGQLILSRTIEEAYENALKIQEQDDRAIYFIGGRGIYDWALDKVNTIFRTTIFMESPADDQLVIWKPEQIDSEFIVITASKFSKDDNNEFSYSISQWSRM